MSRPVLIGLSGFAQVGKDTAAAYLADRFGYSRRAFADALRDLAMAVNPLVEMDAPVPWRYRDAIETLGYEAAKAEVPEVRGFLKALGSGVRAVLGEDTWVRGALDDAQPFTVISDVRFENEAAAIRRHAERLGGYGVVLRIIRPGYGAESDFEREVNTMDVDYHVWNDGSIEQFYRNLDLAMRSVS